MIVRSLGLAGETGELLSEYKKYLRDGEAHRLFKERWPRRWATCSGTSPTWPPSSAWSSTTWPSPTSRRTAAVSCPDTGLRRFDADLPEAERLPRRFEVQLIDSDARTAASPRGHRRRAVRDPKLTDNAYDPDGYRFHDVFHFAFAAVLAWSPVTRSLIRRKAKKQTAARRSRGRRPGGRDRGRDLRAGFRLRPPAPDAGGRGAPRFPASTDVKDMTSHLEVSRRTTGEWEQAIFGLWVWRAVHAAGGGRIGVDLDARRIDYLGPAGGSAAEPGR